MSVLSAYIRQLTDYDWRDVTVAYSVDAVLVWVWRVHQIINAENKLGPNPNEILKPWIRQDLDPCSLGCFFTIVIGFLDAEYLVIFV